MRISTNKNIFNNLINKNTELINKLNENLKNYLPLSGGIMSGGVIRWNDTDFEFKHTTGNTSKRGIVRGGSSWDDGASIYLNGKDNNDAGIFTIMAHDGTNNKSLVGKPDGTFTWGGFNVGTASNIMCGWIEVTPSSANTPTKKTVTFPRVFKNKPMVVACPMGTEGGRKVSGCSVNNFSTTGFDLYLTRTDTVTTGVAWIAIGI